MVALYRISFLVLLIALWYLASIKVGRNLVPSPLATVQVGQIMIADGRLFTALRSSLSIYFSGFLAASVCAIVIGLTMGTIRPIGKTLDMYVYALAATPRVAFIPLIIVLLGLGFEAKVFIVFLGAIMPILINTYAGVLAVDDDLVEMARSVGASSARIFVQIVLPSAVPFIIAGLRLGATVGLINTVVAELYTAVSGLGGLLALYGNTFRMAEYFVIVLSLAATGVVVTEALRAAENRLGAWRRA
jgi:ABC-type nitrate/sulfonate/bicarbonate transport system permease component